MNEQYVMSVDEAAELLHMDPHKIREGIDNKSFEFGTKSLTRSGTPIYKISRRRLLDFLGIKEKR